MPLPPLEDTAFWLPFVEPIPWVDPRDGESPIALRDLVVVFLTRSPDCSRRVEAVVLNRIIVLSTRFIRQKVSRRYPNDGLDIVENALSDMTLALVTPESPLARGLMNHFEPRMRWLIKDNVRRFNRRTRGQDEFTSDMASKTPSPSFDVTDKIWMEQVLALAKDGRQRKMTHERFEDRGWTEIGRLNGCDASTARKQVNELLERARKDVTIKRRA